MTEKAEAIRKASVEELVAWGLDIEEGLTDWEMTFLEDMKRRLDGMLGITPTQTLKLHEIIMEKG